MDLPDAIRSRGFRRWYERQLIEGHAYLVTGLLSLLMMAIALEVIDFRLSAKGFATLLLVGGAGGALTVFAWRRFTYLLARAEYFAGRATCPSCQTYGRFVIDHAVENTHAAGGCTMQVRCRKCDQRWTIE